MESKDEYRPLTHEELVAEVYKKLIKKTDAEIEEILCKFETEG